MLMAEAFSSLLQVWGRGELSAVPTTLIVDQVLMSLYQILVHTLMVQNSNGSWGPSNSREVTAYATLTVSKASILPFVALFRAKIDSAIAAARKFLLSSTDTAPSFLWIEKVTYGSIVLAESYVLAALNVSSKEPLSPSSKVDSLATIPPVDVEQLTRTCFGSLLFDSADTWKLQAAFIEGCLFRPYLQRLVSDVMPGIEDEKAFEVIPFVWTVYNYSAKLPLTTSSLREKMGASLLDRLDGKSFKGNLPPTNGTGHSTNSIKLVNGESMHERPNTTTNGHCEHKESINKTNGSLTHEHTTTNHGDLINEESTAMDISSRVTQTIARVLEGAAPTCTPVTRVPYELTFLLPANFTGNLTDTFFKGTITSDARVNELFATAAQSTFTAYDDEFARIVGPEASVQLVTNRPDSGAFFEAGVYIPSLDEVWFTSTYARYLTLHLSFNRDVPLLRSRFHQLPSARLHNSVQQAHPPIPHYNPSPLRRRRILLLRKCLHRWPESRRGRHGHGPDHPPHLHTLQLLLRPPHHPRRRSSLGPPPPHQRLLPFLHKLLHRPRARRCHAQPRPARRLTQRRLALGPARANLDPRHQPPRHPNPQRHPCLPGPENALRNRQPQHARRRFRGGQPGLRAYGWSQHLCLRSR